MNRAASRYGSPRRRRFGLAAGCRLASAAILLNAPAPVFAQPAESTPPAEAVETQAGNRVEVQPVSSDREIERRLASILKATGWFEEATVAVKDGVVFLDGQTTAERQRAWAGELAGRTRDVVAVVNRIRLVEGPVWNFKPAVETMRNLVRDTVRALPMIALSAVILLVTLFAAKSVTLGMRRVLSDRLKPLVLDVVVRTLALLTFVLGLYLVLHVVGLSRLAATVIGGTGLAGLVAGFAFRDILENYLASILISLRNPFRLGDVVEIAGYTGVVQRVTSRGTVLMDMDGNHIQIPNATVYKSVIHNFTANPNRRDSFQVGIGYENDIARAQEIALKVLAAHPSILKTPEPLVLADALGAATVNLKICFWYDGTVHNGPKLRSSLIRLVKVAFQDHGVSMPDEAREVVFPDGVPLQWTRRPTPESPALETRPQAEASGEPTPPALFTQAEGKPASEADPIRRQARQSRNPEESPDLLADDTDDAASGRTE